MKSLLKKLPLIGRVFFALGVLGIGVEHLIFRDFIIGRAPKWPEFLPGGALWAYVTGGFLILVSLLLITGKKARIAALLMALLVFLWAFLRHIPVLMDSTFLSGDWTAAGKALVFTGGALAIAATFARLPSGNSTLNKLMNLEREFILTGRACLGIFLVITGIQHFLFVEFVASLIPGWFPGDAVFWTYFAGVTLIAGGVGLFIPYTASLAALLSGLMIFSWFWIVHLPRSLTSTSDNIAIFEALAFSGLAFVLMKFPTESGKDG